VVLEQFSSEQVRKMEIYPQCLYIAVMMSHPVHLMLSPATSPELARLEDEAHQLVALTVASKKTARGSNS